MKELCLDLMRSADNADTPEMARLFIRILSAAAPTESALQPLRDAIQQHEARLLSAGDQAATEDLAEIVGILCRRMFVSRGASDANDECEKLILALQRAGDSADTPVMALTFIRLYQLCGAQSTSLTADVLGAYEECVRIEQRAQFEENMTSGTGNAVRAVDALDPLVVAINEWRRSSIESQSRDDRQRLTKGMNLARDRALAAVGSGRWDEVGLALADMLWTLAEARPDFEELPSWIAGAKASGVFGGGTDYGLALAETVYAIVRSVVNCYGDEADRFSVARMESELLVANGESHANNLVIVSASVAVQAVAFRNGVRRLSLAVDKDALHIGRHTNISFHRTLRIPEDGRDYPLPAGFGRLPILRVEDYVDRVPAKWIEQGGFIIPLYQREALFLEFAGVKWRPTIAKVSVGRINAVSGKEHDLKIRPHRQDYVVIPDQRWLDGINSGDGSVSQFVAMPLGQGYTIEAQFTDEEKFGGFQLAVFDSYSGRFPEVDPEQIKRAATTLSLRSRPFIGASSPLLAQRDGMLFSQPQTEPFTGDEMGIAAGGRIKQQILEDSYGVESWDEAVFRNVVIHIVNSESYERITGLPVPPSPITAEHYAYHNIPWYSDYNENARAIAPVGAFKRILSIGKIDKNRGTTGNGSSARSFQPEDIVRIRAQTLDERLKALIERARQSSQSGNHRIAKREASQAIDLSEKHPLPFLIRAIANLQLELFSDAEADASACLELQPENLGALSIRAHSCLALGEVRLVKEDAESILASRPDDQDALYLRAESNLQLKRYEAALGDSEKLLEIDPLDRVALRIRAEALTKLP